MNLAYNTSIVELLGGLNDFSRHFYSHFMRIHYVSNQHMLALIMMMMAMMVEIKIKCKHERGWIF